MVIIIDHSDLFTYNLAQYYKQITEEVHIYREDEITVQQIEQLQPNLIVFSSGNGTPKDKSKSREILEALQGKFPIFGVGLGFQLIYDYYGGSIIKGKRPMTGQTSKVIHDGLGSFQSVPSDLTVTRYDSFVADPSNVPQELIVTARDEEGTIMGVRHKTNRIEGVQFYPDSILTEHGFQIIENSYNQLRV